MDTADRQQTITNTTNLKWGARYIFQRLVYDGRYSQIINLKNVLMPNSHQLVSNKL